MKIKIIFILTVVVLNVMNCSTSLQMLPEPEAAKNLLIGTVIFDINGYQDKFISIKENIEVAIVGRFKENGLYKNFGTWATTDEDGYFYIANVPDGEYAIKGFRAYCMEFGDLKVMNDLTDAANNYYYLLEEGIINFGGNLFNTSAKQRIINLEYNIFTLYPNEIIDVKHYSRLRDIKLSTGEYVDYPPVPVYFMEKFENSGWIQFLNLQL